MHNLEQQIRQWRNEMTQGVAREALEELEGHLREAIDEHRRAGLAEAEAFRRAVAEVGSRGQISSEFRKLDGSMWWPLKAAIGLGVAVAIALAIVLASRFNAGTANLVLAVHVFAVTVGYAATLLIGGVGICFVCQRLFFELSPTRLESVSRASFVFAAIAAAFTAIGIGFSMIWAKAEWGRFWSWDPKETGGACVLAWLIFFMAAHRSRRMGARGVLLWTVFGNVVVSLAWFGANALAQIHSYGGTSYFLPGIVTGFNLLFLFVGLAPAGCLRRGKA